MYTNIPLLAVAMSFSAPKNYFLASIFPYFKFPTEILIEYSILINTEEVLKKACNTKGDLKETCN